LAAEHGARVVLDLHNYGRYRLSIFGKPQTLIIDQRVAGAIAVSRGHLADLWLRLAEAFAGESAVFGFGLMNEPHDMGGANWKDVSQVAVEAIRRANRDVPVIVAGDAWSGAHSFADANGPKAWIEDPAGAVIYEAHCYFDADASGRYQRSYADELASDPALPRRGAQRIGAFLAWLRHNGARGFLGEFGIPAHDSGWQAVLRNMLTALPACDFPACYWAAGEWWGAYPLSVHPTANFGSPAPQLALLKELLAS
jgi:endoglucanase